MGITGDELQDHLTDQLQFLASSAAAFDKGSFAEAKRMAVTVRVLLHQTRSSDALLEQMGMRTTVRYRSMGALLKQADFLRGGLSTGPLVSMVMTASGWEYRPKLGIPELELPLSQWWEGLVYVTHSERFSRRRVVLDLANKGGGAHIDSSESNSYRNVVHNGSLGWIEKIDFDDGTSVQRQKTNINDPLPSMMRTIAHEILVTLRK